nr:diguanylate cyclase [Thiomicrorhabdus sp. 6S3-12]
MFVKRPVFFILFLFGILIAQSIGAQSKTLTLGVYAYQSKEKTFQEFSPIADFLSRDIDGIEVKLVVMRNQEIRKAVRSGQVDMLLISPSLYEIIRHESFISGITATLERYRDGVGTSSLGGVIISRKGSKFKELKDLRKAKIAIPSESNSGAFRIPLYELVSSGIRYQQLDFMKVGSNDHVMEAVLSGKADVGFVRTGILENWLGRGELSSLDEVQIINRRDLKSFPFILSTHLYPEWAFIIMPNVGSDDSRKIASSLFKINRSLFAENEIDGIQGFVSPLNYLPFEMMLRELRLEPYDVVQKPSFSEIWNSYWRVISFVLLAVFAIVFALWKSEKYRGIAMMNHKRLENIITATRVGTWEWDLAKDRMEINEHYVTQIGYTRDELQPFNFAKFASLVHPDDLLEMKRKIQDNLAGKENEYEMDLRLRHKKGRWIWIHSRGKVITRSKDGNALLMGGTHVEVTEKKAFEEKLKRAAMFDSLTELPGRNYFEEHLEAALFNANKKTKLALLFIDLDGFKEVNDSFGHHAGDELLKIIARRLTDSTKSTDFVARMGGDEFLVLLSGFQDSQQLYAISERILHKVNEAVSIDGNTMHVSCSIGIREIQPDSKLSVESIINQADRAMYKAKNSGKNRINFYH